MTTSLRQTIAKLDARNQDMRLVLDNVSQGLLVMEGDGTILSERSAVIDAWFGPVLAGKKLWEYLAPHEPRTAQMLELGWAAVCEGVLPLELTLAQMPKQVMAAERVYQLAYEPILIGGAVTKALVVVSDVTQKVRSERLEAEQRQFLGVVERLMKDRSGLLAFVAEADGVVRRLVGTTEDAVEAQRSIHTLRGDAAMFGLTNLAETCRGIESRMHETGEALSLAERNELLAQWERFSSRFLVLTGGDMANTIEIDEEEYADILRAVMRGTPQAQLTQMIQDWKLEPLEKSFGRSLEQAKALVRRLGKGEVAVVVESNHLRLDGASFRPFWAAFAHVVRNAVDHGIDSPEERRALGKPEAARISLSARLSGDDMAIEISDDGRGIDWDGLSARARARGLHLASREDLLFAHGLSTREVADEWSGRGVGMGAVRAACESLGGRVEVSSTRGRGTTIRFIMPIKKTAPLKAETEVRV
jgi:two-component system chemotaxis sensor kinase CheA